jgi:hypothetical protein
VAGLNHESINDGQLLRLVERAGRWQVEEVAALPAAAYAIASDENGDFVVAVSDGLILVASRKAAGEAGRFLESLVSPRGSSTQTNRLLACKSTPQ